MKLRPAKLKRAFTLTELMAAILVSSIVILSTGIVLVNNQKGWSSTYDRVYSDAVTDGYAAKGAFDSIIRKASVAAGENLGSSGEQAEVYYYNNVSSPTVDRYAKFYVASGALKVEHGTWSGGVGVASNTTTVARDVNSVNFSASGDSVQMILKLNNENGPMTVMCSAVRQNP